MGWLSNLFGKKQQPVIPETGGEDMEWQKMKAVVVSDLGNIRTNNEDNGLFYNVTDEHIIRSKGYMLLVADGMGGHNAGEEASKMAGDIITREYFNSAGADVEKNIKRALVLANKSIYEKASTQKAFEGMGTTCTVLVVINRDIYYGHVGDSRAYIQKGDAILQITEDHTYVQELVKSGDITAEEAAVHPKRNILTNAMGTKPEMRVDTGKSKYSFDKNDRLLLCSDGLYDYLNDNELKEMLTGSELKMAADRMVQQAKSRGGHDNITVVLAEKDIEITAETELKLTRDVDLLKMTRDADLPSDI